jgi:hypothetical protein
MNADARRRHSAAQSQDQVFRVELKHDRTACINLTGMRSSSRAGARPDHPIADHDLGNFALMQRGIPMW